MVRAPARIPAGEVQNFFTEKKTWIDKKLAQLSVQQRNYKAKQFLSGEDFSYLGRSHKLVVSPTADFPEPLLFIDDTFYLDERYRGVARELFTAWYKERAEAVMRERVKIYSESLRVSPGRERITSARCQWGCCSATNNLSFSWRLVMAPLTMIDYIVVHELAHIKEKNHSSRFWKIVELVLPDYPNRRNWLKQYGYMLRI